MISGVFCAAAEVNEPVCATCARFSARMVPATPRCPWSRVCVPAVEHASHPVARIAAASAGGVLNTGYPVNGGPDIGVSTWHNARSAPPTYGLILTNMGAKL